MVVIVECELFKIITSGCDILLGWTVLHYFVSNSGDFYGFFIDKQIVFLYTINDLLRL
jgi:hypothetical protein